MGRLDLYRRFGLLAGAAVIALVLVLSAVNGLRSADLASIDARFALRGDLGPPRDIVLVGIDAATFDYLDAHRPREAHFPFPRRLDARLIRNLSRAGAKVIAYDEQFTEQTDPADDNALILAVRAARNVVLTTSEVGPGGTTRIFGGGQGLALSRATPADGEFPIDSDGTLRSTRPQILGLITFPLAVAQRVLGHPLPFPGGSDATAPIDFRGPAGTVPPIPFWRVLEDQFPPASVRGKIVVIGATEPVLQDVHTTPTSPAMSGAEVQANAIDTALRGFPLRRAAGWVNVVLVIALGLAAPLLALRLPALRAAGAALVVVAALAVICQLAFDGGTIIGFVYPAVAALLSALAVLVMQMEGLQKRLPRPVADFFVSYRRGQSELAANMLKEGLARKFGERRVFLDTDGIGAGERWPRRIEEAIAACRAMLIVIGPHWLEARAADGSRRLDDPDDWVRREIETALASDEIVLVPVLHDGAQAPRRDQLPDSIKALADCQAIPLTGLKVDRWVDELAESIDDGRLRRVARIPAAAP